MANVEWVKVEGKLFNDYMAAGINRDNALALAGQDVRAMKAEMDREAKPVERHSGIGLLYIRAGA